MTEIAAPPAQTAGKFRVPWPIKRNVGLIGLTLTFTGAGMQFAYGFGPLMVQVLTGSPGLAGLSVALIGISRFLVAYPVGKITDTFGRKPGILLGLALALVGALVLGSSMWFHSTVVFIFGLLMFGMGMNAAQQMRGSGDRHVSVADARPGARLCRHRLADRAAGCADHHLLFREHREKERLRTAGAAVVLHAAADCARHDAGFADPAGPEGDRPEPCRLLSRSHLSGCSTARKGNDQVPSSRTDGAVPDPAGDGGELLGPGEYVDRHGADVADPAAPRLFAVGDRGKSRFPCGRHVRLYRSARHGRGPARPARS